MTKMDTDKQRYTTKKKFNSLQIKRLQDKVALHNWVKAMKSVKRAYKALNGFGRESFTEEWS